MGPPRRPSTKRKLQRLKSVKDGDTQSEESLLLGGGGMANMDRDMDMDGRSASSASSNYSDKPLSFLAAPPRKRARRKPPSPESDVNRYSGDKVFVCVPE